MGWLGKNLKKMVTTMKRAPPVELTFVPSIPTKLIPGAIIPDECIKNMELKEAYKATRIIESLENFTITHDKSLAVTNYDNRLEDNFVPIKDEEVFWGKILSDPDSYWGESFKFSDVVLSDWIPRVPGLFFSKGAKTLRDTAFKFKDDRSKEWFEYYPIGKSATVLGGLGTFILPQDTLGNRMMSISHNRNASEGIPVLISNEVWERYSLQPGDLLNINGAKWIKLSADWAQRFPSIKGIPRGCIALNDINQKISKVNDNGYVQFQPFTIMEYEYKNSILYDYVFITLDRFPFSPREEREQMEQFFEYYRTKDGRNGKYLIQVDMNNPLFDAIYNTPEELLKQNQYGESQLRLITKRLRNIYFSGNTIDYLISFINTHYSLQDDLTALCVQANINPGIIAGNKVAEKVVVLVDYCIEKGIVEQLIDSIAIKHGDLTYAYK